MPLAAIAAKETDAEKAARIAALADGDTRLNAFMAEFKDAIAPLLAKHALTLSPGAPLPDPAILHHRGSSGSRAHIVLHFYVYAPPAAPVKA